MRKIASMDELKDLANSIIEKIKKILNLRKCICIIKE